MITIKKPEEIKILAEGGKKLALILEQLIKAVKPGSKTIALDQLAEKLILEAGGAPAFKNHRDHEADQSFPTTICASVNEQLVHTPASNYQLKKGDILSLDIGMKYPAQDGFYTDLAVTIPIGQISAIARKLIKVTQKSLMIGISQVKPGNILSDIGKAIQDYVESQGFSVVRQLVGHGVGYAVHEEPRIPNFYQPSQPVIELKEGMVLAIEPMINIGESDVKTLADGLTIVTADGSLCAHFEHTIVVTENGCEILTKI
ncbi:MAG: type I methionyl aminopeptidase [Candidatus Buchananbacteria bacterium RIFCSPHIGHO2_01_FULL_39_14]|uniref:Methionine aminopeptidase n=1 Tax=Candidatus Buchananbacteria bacterium RIFCSPHIGHO2_01_FULL_39_14 TaxID=1797532 RepID=A0A1G1XW29_9BACT|nr:MAG: type I methionyl aminopeptidase [Candidatus Buchananbacteria bacterium RIFCSPHIGHO2_01_FULL_39_14]OGY49319.1 MAG: type I methionyl aminopeptidase [Candidatus Buchananbacteria bacterium RIFCSPHIGHO2_02_FULL_39_17]